MANVISYGPSLAELTFVMMDLFSRNDRFGADKKTLLTVYDPDDGETENDETDMEVSITSVQILNIADQQWLLTGKVEVCLNQIGRWQAKYCTKNRKGTWAIVSEDEAENASPDVVQCYNVLCVTKGNKNGRGKYSPHTPMAGPAKVVTRFEKRLGGVFVAMGTEVHFHGYCLPLIGTRSGLGDQALTLQVEIPAGGDYDMWELYTDTSTSLDPSVTPEKLRVYADREIARYQ